MPNEPASAPEQRAARILVVDDEPAVAEALQLVLESAGYSVRTAGTASGCLHEMARQPCDLVLLDLMLPDRSGLDALADILRMHPSLPVLMLTAYGSIETAVQATRLGAANFLTKPWNNSQLLLEIERSLERRSLKAENARLRRKLGLANPMEGLVGRSDAMLAIFMLIRQVARTTSTVLVSGESGTGKDVVARAIHNASPRAEKPFVTVNSGRIPGEQLESSLFGHVRGAFAGAIRDRRGCFEIADGGTIFLDEVGALSRQTQAKLLRVIEEREFVRVGSNEPVQIDVRIIAASNENLAAAAQAGRFRHDLYYRLNVIGIELPPLRGRMDDLPLLVSEFMTQLCRREKQHFLDEEGNSTLRFTPEAHRILMTHDWPGNVRELRNVVERAVVLATSEELGPELLPGSLLKERAQQAGVKLPAAAQRTGASLSEMVSEFERGVIEESLERHRFNQTETAKALRVALSTLNQKIQRLGIAVKRRRRTD